MTIEVRQLLVKSTVGGAAPAPDRPDAPPPEQQWERLKQELLAECKAWLGEQLRAARER